MKTRMSVGSGSAQWAAARVASAEASATEPGGRSTNGRSARTVEDVHARVEPPGGIELVFETVMKGDDGGIHRTVRG